MPRRLLNFNNSSFGNRLFTDKKIRNVPSSTLSKLKTEVRRIKQNKQLDVFQIIFPMAVIIGIPVYPFFISPKKKIVNYLLQIWCNLIIFFRTHCVATEVFYNHRLWPSLATSLCFMIYCIVGYVAMLMSVLKRNKIVASVRKIIYLSSILNNTEGHNMSCFLFALFVCTSFTAAFLVLIHKFFTKGAQTYFYNTKDLNPFPEDSNYFYIYGWNIVFSIIITYNFASVTMFILGLLICYSYRKAGQLLTLFGKKLHKEVKDASLTVTGISENLSLYKTIVQSIQELDDAFNACTFCIYAAALNNIFNLMSIVLSSDSRFRTPNVDAILGLRFVSALCLFFSVTYCGEDVPTRNHGLKKEMIQLSCLVTKQSLDIPTILMFNLLFENIISTKVYVTGFKLFNISTNFILSTFGMMVTYGVLLYQIGAVDG